MRWTRLRFRLFRLSGVVADSGTRAVRPWAASKGNYRVVLFAVLLESRVQRSGAKVRLSVVLNRIYGLSLEMVGLGDPQHRDGVLRGHPPHPRPTPSTTGVLRTASDAATAYPRYRRSAVCAPDFAFGPSWFADA